MIKLTINNKEYKYPQDYSEVTLSKFKEIQDFLYSDHNKERTERVIDGKTTKDNEEDTLNFMIEFINYVTDIPTRQLKDVRPYSSKAETFDDVSIESLFYSLSFLFMMPSIENPKPQERIGNYHFIDKIDLTQAILKDANFIEYTEANAVSKAFNEAKEGRYENLNLLLAIMYRPKHRENWYRKPTIEQYNYDTVHERAKEFNNLKMDIVWNCLFFFMQLKVNSLKSIEHYSKEVLEKEQHSLKD